MREISPDELYRLNDDAGAVFGTLVYAPMPGQSILRTITRR